ncbi:uncharacterized protein LOC131694575 [Topomyia yanbarensis]|uniref:uncharacterized protein LOC131694575 n=1 Tax=Topomyia yanbarensis TaxID=2498891 RepID=UPI00273BEB5B|nr:uncharacterized protein LOC131694575 [Topomyia yanbarensis]
MYSTKRSVDLRRLYSLNPQMAAWKRPDHIPYPHVWHTFRARDPTSKQLVTYRVQDLPPNRLDDAVDHMCKYFLRDEPICASLNLTQDPVGVSEISSVWRSIAQQRCIVVCFQDGRDDIVGLNMLTVVSRNDPKPSVKFQSSAVQTFVDCTNYMTQKANLFERYPQMDQFLSAWGLSVHPEFRGCGLSTEILRARIPLCRAMGLRLSATVFSHAGSQIPAAKVGFRDVVVERFADLAAKGFRFSVNVDSNKLMALEIEE